MTTKRFNEAFKRNKERFPEDFAFRLTSAEPEALNRPIEFENPRNSLGKLRSQIATSKISDVTETIEGRGGRRTLPWVFTEHGAVMASNLLKSDRAVRMSVFVVRTFVRMREQVAANADILLGLSEIDLALLERDEALRDFYDKLLPLLVPPSEPPKPARTLGFHQD